MNITKKSMITGNITSREIDVSQEQLDKWRAGSLIQEVMPAVSIGDREFLITGITEVEWEEHMGDED